MEIKNLEELLRDGETEIQDGIFLKSSGEINLKIFHENDKTVLDFGSPKVYISAKSIGKAQVTNFLEPSLDRIVITKDSFLIVLKNWMDLEYPR